MSRRRRKLLALLLVPVGMLGSAAFFLNWQLSGFKSPIDDRLMWPFLACVVATVALPIMVWPHGAPVRVATKTEEAEQDGPFRAVMFVLAVAACVLGSAVALAPLPTIAGAAGLLLILRVPERRPISAVPAWLSVCALAVAFFGWTSVFVEGSPEPVTLVVLGVFALALVAAMVRRPPALSAAQTTEE